jgi:hypothetical protein
VGGGCGGGRRDLAWLAGGRRARALPPRRPRRAGISDPSCPRRPLPESGSAHPPLPIRPQPTCGWRLDRASTLRHAPSPAGREPPPRCTAGPSAIRHAKPHPLLNHEPHVLSLTRGHAVCSHWHEDTLGAGPAARCRAARGQLMALPVYHCRSQPLQARRVSLLARSPLVLAEAVKILAATPLVTAPRPAPTQCFWEGYARSRVGRHCGPALPRPDPTQPGGPALTRIRCHIQSAVCIQHGLACLSSLLPAD